MERHSRPAHTLDGSWQFRTDPDAALTPESPGAWRTLDVPGPWQAQAEDLRSYQGVAWYQRLFEIPPSWGGQQIVLRFGAVDDIARVWVNGAEVGAHTGGYLPFEIDITPHARAGELNALVVRVEDPDDDRARWATPFAEIPHGKQSWYGPLSGIWQSVSIEARQAAHLTRLHVTPDLRTGAVQVDLRCSPAAEGREVAVALRGPDGALVAEGRGRAIGGAARLLLSVAAAIPWELEAPALYTATASLPESGDSLTARFGFRTIESRDGAIFLNGRALMLRGALDQDYYPDGICTPPSAEYLRHQAQLAKRMGLNCLRCHIKIPDPRYLEAADEVGLLIWSELPNWARWTPEGGARGVETLRALLERDWNHPSLVILSVINESWGIDQTNPEHRAWLLDAFDQVKGFAGDRLVVDNSACFNNFHLKSDLDDYHFYAAMPDERARWSEWVRQFAARPKWSYGAELPPISPGAERWTLGDAGYGAPLPEVQRSGAEPLIVSEFGNWGLPSLADLRGPAGSDPWWFETGDDWGDGVVYPHGVEQRFARLGLARIFGGYERFAAATRRAELDALTYEIEEMRRHPAIGGYVITEFTDVHWECNGLLDMRRNPKMPLDALAALNADTLLIPDRGGRALWAGEERAIPLLVSHWGAATLEGAEVRLSLQGGDAPAHGARVTFAPAPPAAIPPRATAPLGQIEFHAPDADRPTLYTLRATLWQAGRQIAATSLRLPVYPCHAGARQPIHIDGGDTGLRERLARRGHPLADAAGAQITVATRFDAPLRERVLAGERVALLAVGEGSIAAPLGPLRVQARAGTPWQGSWASSFAWLAGDWAGDGVLDDRFMGVMPTHVITGFSQVAFPSAVEAGLAVGWVQKPVAITGTLQLGRGSVTITTFQLASASEGDPVAELLLDRLLG
jgi:Glycosyl hydrolases family 2, sugar binding domain/Glycosyl hydrolases family 2, TIM barrel domain